MFVFIRKKEKKKHFQLNRSQKSKKPPMRTLQEQPIIGFWQDKTLAKAAVRITTGVISSINYYRVLRKVVIR